MSATCGLACALKQGVVAPAPVTPAPVPLMDRPQVEPGPAAAAPSEGRQEPPAAAEAPPKPSSPARAAPKGPSPKRTGKVRQREDDGDDEGPPRAVRGRENLQSDDDLEGLRDEDAEQHE